MTLASWLKKHRLVVIVAVAGVLYSLYLQEQVISGVFFSGDAGLKAVLAKQFCSGDFHLDLRLPADPWVLDLWHQGLYPFGPTFVYEMAGRYYAVFPAAFSAISAPFYALLGYRGLHVIPLVSVWVVWLTLVAVCRGLGLSDLGSAVALAILVFASPLTMYSAMYWEHTLTVCLAFGGLAMALLSQPRASGSRHAALGGLLVGLSVWFRTEQVCLVGVICAALFVFRRLRDDYKHKVALICGMLLPILLLAAFNQGVFGHPLGARSLWVSDKLRLYGRIERSRRILQSMCTELLVYFPMVLFPAAGIVLSLLSRRVTLPRHVRIQFWGSVAFILSVALVLPNSGGKQWGPRYLLLLTPIASLLTGAVMETVLGSVGVWGRRFAIAILLLLFGLGFYRNTCLGAPSLRDDYRGRVLPALDLVAEHESRIVVVAHQWISQEMESILDRKVFFRTLSADDLGRLAVALVDHGHRDFLYLTLDYQAIPDDQEFRVGDDAMKIEFSGLGLHGSYLIYEARIIDQEGQGSESRCVEPPWPPEAFARAPRRRRPSPLTCGAEPVGRGGRS